MYGREGGGGGTGDDLADFFLDHLLEVLGDGLVELEPDHLNRFDLNCRSKTFKTPQRDPPQSANGILGVECAEMRGRANLCRHLPAALPWSLIERRPY